MYSLEQQFRAGFYIIPQEIRQKILTLHQEYFPMGTGLFLGPHGKGSTWRLRWRLPGERKMLSFSIGSDPDVRKMIELFVRLWRKGSYAFLTCYFGEFSSLPLKFINYYREKGFDDYLRPVHNYSAEPSLELTQRERDVTGKLPSKLFVRLMSIWNKNEVQNTKFRIFTRKDRGSYVLRWRQYNTFDECVHRSLKFDCDDNLLQAVREILQSWKSGRNPLLGIIWEKDLRADWSWKDFARLAERYPDACVTDILGMKRI